MKQIAVLGLGHFGSGLARSLTELHVEVLGVDRNEDKVNALARTITHTVQADVLDENALDALGLDEFDAVVLCIKDVETSSFATIALKNHGAKRVVAQAISEAHAKILERIGADEIIMPEGDMAIRLARSLASCSNLTDYMELSATHSLAEIQVLDEWIGKTLIESKIRNKYGLNIVAIRSGDQLKVSPQGEDILQAGDMIVVIGENNVLSRFLSHRF